MAVTRLKRKGRRNKVVAKGKVDSIQRLNAVPVIKQVDIEKLKAEYKALATPVEKAPKAKVEVAEEAPKKAAAKKPAAKKAAPKKDAEAKTEAKPKAAAKKPAAKKAAPKKEDKEEK